MERPPLLSRFDGFEKAIFESTIRYVQGTGLIGTVVAPIPTTALYTNAAKTKHG